MITIVETGAPPTVFQTKYTDESGKSQDLFSAIYFLRAFRPSLTLIATLRFATTGLQSRRGIYGRKNMGNRSGKGIRGMQTIEDDVIENIPSDTPGTHTMAH